MGDSPQGFGKNKDGAQLVGGTNTCHWCKKSQVQKHKKNTYARAVVGVRPEEADPNRVRITAGENRLEYYGETSTETASSEAAKILINSVSFTKNAKSMAMDISNFYIQTDLPDYQYIRSHMPMIPQATIGEYNLGATTQPGGWYYAGIRKCMYGLGESGYLPNLGLKRTLTQGYSLI